MTQTIQDFIEGEDEMFPEISCECGARDLLDFGLVKSSMCRLLERVAMDLPKEANERNSARVSKDFYLSTEESLGWNACLKEVKDLLNSYLTQLK